MGRQDRFVKPKTIQIEISDGDTIQIKKELTVGEVNRMQAAGLKQMTASKEGEVGKWDVDIPAARFAKVREYLVDWSFVEPSLNKNGEQIIGKDGKPEVVPVELTEDAIRNLDEATFEELEKAIDEHTEQLDKEKKAASGRTKSAQT
jgi:DNA mismatch repair ATPase MutS